MVEFLLLCLIFWWNPFSIIFKIILIFWLLWLITKKEFRITIGVIGLIVLICYQPRVLIILAIAAIIYKLCNLTAAQKIKIGKVKDNVTKSISKFFKTHWKNIIYAVCLLVFFIILFSILGSLSTNEVDDKKNTKNQIVNTGSYKPNNHYQTTWTKKEIEIKESSGTAREQKISETISSWWRESEIQQKPKQQPQQEKLYNSKWEEIILDPIDINDYPDFNRNMDISLYNNCQTYTWWRKSKIENEWKSYWAFRWCNVAVIYSEPDDACLWISACWAWWTQFYNMVNLKTNQSVYSCISSDCETELQKKLNVLRPFPAYEFIYADSSKIQSKSNTTTTYTSTYSSNSNRTSSKNSYDWYDDPEPSEFYEYDNFDDYYDNYWNYYDDYTYDELKEMYDDERSNDRPYLEYDDYYDDVWYDYYWWYDWYDSHYDDYVDEYWYED